MAAEESGKIVSASFGLKSYLPAHSVITQLLRLVLCIFADAIREGYAEAKHTWASAGEQKRKDAIREGYAEAIIFHGVSVSDPSGK